MKRLFYLILFLPYICFSQENVKSIIYDSVWVNSPVAFPANDFVFETKIFTSFDIPFTINDVLKKQSNDSLLLSVPQLFENIDERVNFRNETRVMLFNFGVKLGEKKRNYCSISNEIVSDFDIEFNREFLDYLIRGNYNYIGKEVSQDRQAMGYSLYNSSAISFARKIKPSLIVELKAKYLIGFVNLNFEKFNFDLYSSNPIDDDSFYTQIKYDILVHTSGIDATSKQNYKKNKGYAFDVGAEYIYNEQLRFAAAVKDMGWINWHASNNLSLVQDSIHRIESLIDGSDLEVSISDQISETLDSLSKEINVDSLQYTYTSYLPTQIYIGAHYQINPRQDVSIVFHNRVLSRSSYKSFNITYQYQLKPSVLLQGYYSIVDGSYNNLGLGCTLQTPRLDFVFATQNLLAFDVINAEKTAFKMALRLKFNRSQSQKKNLHHKFTNFKYRF